MRRLMMLAAVMLALVAALAVPAMADDFNHHNDFFFPNNNFVNTPGVFQGFANESESGNVTPSFSVQSSGDNSNQCVTPLQFGNTGNFNNAQGVLSFGTEPFDNNGFDNGFGPFGFDGFFGNGAELEGGNFTFAPVLSGGCTQQVQQSSAASSD